MVLPQSFPSAPHFAPLLCFGEHPFGSEAASFPIACGFFPLCCGFFHHLSNFLPLLSILRDRYPQKSFESIRGGNSVGGSWRASPSGWGRGLCAKCVLHAMFTPENSHENHPQTAEAVKMPILQEATPKKFKFRPKSPKMGADWRKSELPPNLVGHWEGVK